MTTVLAYLTSALMLLGPAARWIDVSGVPGPSGSVVQLRGETIPTRLVCDDVRFESTGADAVAESSFVVVVSIVVDRAGRVRRFRIERQPPIPLDLERALRPAFAKWRYAIPADRRGESFGFPVVLEKPAGGAATAACH